MITETVKTLEACSINLHRNFEATLDAVRKLDAADHIDRVVIMTEFNERALICSRSCMILDGRVGIISNFRLRRLYNMGIDECVCVVDDNERVIIGIYLSPSLLKPVFSERIEKLSLLIHRHQHKQLILAGDVNCTNEAWSYRIRPETAERGRDLASVLRAMNLMIINKPCANNYTRIDPSTGTLSWIDIMACSKCLDSFILGTKMTDWINSDHRAIVTRIRKGSIIDSRTRIDWKLYERLITNAAWPEIKNAQSTLDLDRICLGISDTVRICLDTATSATRTRCEWDAQLDIQKSHVNRLKKRLSKCPADRLEIAVLLYKRARNKYNNLLKDNKRKIWDSLSKRSDPWKTINRFIGKRWTLANDGPAIDYWTQEGNFNADISRILDDFETARDSLNTENLPVIRGRLDPDAVERALKALNVKAASGIDNIPTRAAVISIRCRISYFCELLGTLTSTGYFPRIWKQSKGIYLFLRQIRTEEDYYTYKLLMAKLLSLLYLVNLLQKRQIVISIDSMLTFSIRVEMTY